MRNLVCIMFITNNHPLLQLRWKGNLVKHEKVPKYYDHDCRSMYISLCKTSSTLSWYVLWQSLLYIISSESRKDADTCLTITWVICGTSKEKLYQELSIESFENRHGLGNYFNFSKLLKTNHWVVHTAWFHWEFTIYNEKYRSSSSFWY